MLAVIVVNYKNCALTREFVTSELPKMSIPYQVVIVDNEGDTSSREELSEDIGDVHILTNPVNSGFAIANNMGARFAIEKLHADNLLFSNNDIRFISNNVVEQLVTILETFPSVGIVGPKIIGLDGKCQSPEPYVSFFDRHIWMYLATPFLSKNRKAERFQFDYSEKAEEGFHYKLMGSFFMVRAKDYANCGMMDEATFLYSEEPILTERMANIGLKPYYCPRVSVLHEHGATTRSSFDRRRIDNLKFKSECYYYRKYKHTPLWMILIGKIVHLSISLIK